MASMVIIFLQIGGRMRPLAGEECALLPLPPWDDC
jgi:hypothetical protein